MPTLSPIVESSVEVQKPARQPFRLALLFAAVVLVKPFSNLFMTWGVHTISPPPFNSAFLGYVLDPLLVLGVAMQIFCLLARMALLSVADLTFVLPVTASGYVISAMLGRVFLHEHVTPVQWVGTLMIFAGASLAGSTPGFSQPTPNL